MRFEVVDHTSGIAWRYRLGRSAQSVAVVVRVIEQQACQYKFREVHQRGRTPADRTSPLELDDRGTQHICESAAVTVRKVHRRNELEWFDRRLAEQRSKLSFQGFACHGKA